MNKKILFALFLAASMLASCSTISNLGIGGESVEEEMELQEIKPIPTEAIVPESTYYRDELEEDSTKKAILDELCCYLVMKKIGVENQYNIRYDYGYSNYWGYHVLDDFSWTEFGNSYNAMMNHITPPPPPPPEEPEEEAD